MANVIDDKVATFRTEPGQDLQHNRWDYLRGRVQTGVPFDSSVLKNWFKRLEITESDLPPGYSADDVNALKANYAYLQLGCVIRDGNRVAVFLRPAEEPDGRRKQTTGPEIVRMWSPIAPHGTAPDRVQLAFEWKTGFVAGRPIVIKPYGGAFNELTRDEGHLGAGYVLLLYIVEAKEADFKPGTHGGTSIKAGEERLGFYDAEQLFKRNCTYLNKGTGKQETVEFQGRFDNLILEALATGRNSVQSGTVAGWHLQSHLLGNPLEFSEKVGAGKEEKGFWSFRTQVVHQAHALVAHLIFEAIRLGFVLHTMRLP